MYLFSGRYLKIWFIKNGVDQERGRHEDPEMGSNTEERQRKGWCPVQQLPQYTL